MRDTGRAPRAIERTLETVLRGGRVPTGVRHLQSYRAQLRVASRIMTALLLIERALPSRSTSGCPILGCPIGFPQSLIASSFLTAPQRGQPQKGR
jgi:hypothetical protein